MSEKTPVFGVETAETPEKENTAAAPESTEQKNEEAANDTPADKKEKNKKAKKEKRGKFNKNKKDEKELTEEEKKALEEKKKRKPKNTKKAAKRLLGYIVAQKRWLVVVAFLVVLTTIIGVLSTLAMQPIYKTLEEVIKTKNISGSDAMAEIVKWILVTSVAYAISAIFSFLYTRILLSTSLRVVANLRRDLFNHLQHLPVSYFDKRKTGEIMSHFTSDVSNISDLVSSDFPSIISSTISAVMTITIMIIMSWKITLTITFAIALMMLVVMIITSKCAPLFKKAQQATAECNGYVEEYVRGIKAVKIFCYEDRSKKQFAFLNETLRKTGVKSNIIGGLMGPLLSMIMRINYAIALSFGVWLVLKGQMQLPSLITYLSYAQNYGSPIASIAGSYNAFIAALAGAERIFEVLDTDVETDEGKVTLVKIIKNQMGEEIESDEGALYWKVPDDESGEVSYVPVRCDIDIKDVTFSYVEGTPVLKHVSTHANSGEKLAFVGSTGAGKTTITNLINRFYDVQDGVITIDSIPINNIKKSSLRSSMAFVLQDSRLFPGTIKENIRYGKLDATDEEIVAAAKLANAASFIEKLPDGYDTELNADGVNISMGQAQLLNIARTAIAGKPLLVLDEATSSIDTRTERLIEKGMDKLMADKTVLVIAHRLSTVRNSENIIVLEGGEIIESGNHDELIALGKKYYQLYTGAFEMT